MIVLTSTGGDLRWCRVADVGKPLVDRRSGTCLLHHPGDLGLTESDCHFATPNHAAGLRLRRGSLMGTGEVEFDGRLRPGESEKA